MDNFASLGVNETAQLPYNLEAEQSVIGAILLDGPCIVRVMEFLSPECFFRKQHSQIFSIMIRMFTTGQSIDFVTVLDAAIKEKVFESEADAKVYLAQVAQIVPSSANVEAYAKIVREKYYVRSLILAAKGIIEDSQDQGNEAASLLDLAEQRIFDIRKGRDSSGLKRIDEIIVEAYDRLQKLSSSDKSDLVGLSTGYSALDRLITGLNKSDLILLAARPAMGKTSFALNIAANVAKKTDKAVAVFSLEMSAEQLVTRLLSGEACVSNTELRTGNLKGEDWVKLAQAADVLARSNIYIDDSSGMTVGEMKAKLRRLPNLGLVVIDYLQLMSSGRRIDNRVQEVSEITRSLKNMAKDLNVPVITLSQLSRSVESRKENHRPILSDLRESGSIEQDADIVLFLYRDAYYNPETEEQNMAECIVAKNRHGETDTAKLLWDGAHTRFLNLELFRDEP